MSWWSHEEKYLLFKMRLLTKNFFDTFFPVPLSSINDLLNEAQEYLSWSHPFAEEPAKDILNEIKYLLTNNPIFELEHFKNEALHLRSAITEYFNNKNKDKQIILLSTFSKKIVNYTYVRLHIDTIKLIYAGSSPQYHKVDKVLNSFICEMLNEGYSLSYLNKIANDINMSDISFDSFLELLLSKLDPGNKRAIECYLSFELPKKGPFISSFNNEIYLGKPEDSDEQKWLGFFDSNFDYAKVIVEASDCQFAANQSAYVLESFLKTINVSGAVMDDQYDPSIRKEVLLIDNENINRCNKENILKPIKLVNVSDLFRLMESRKERNLETYHQLNRAIYWGVQSNQPYIEASLVHLWTAMESLFLNFHGGIIDRVVKYVPCYVGMYYMDIYSGILRKMLRHQKNVNVECESLVAAAKEVNWEKEEVALFLMEHYEDVIRHCDRADVLKRLIIDYVDLLTGENKLYYRIKEICDETVNNLRKIYRLRNKLVHQGYIAPVAMAKCVIQLQFYFEITVNNLIYYYIQCPQLGIEELLTAKEESFYLYKETIKKDVSGKVNEIIYPSHLYMLKSNGK